MGDCAAAADIAAATAAAESHASLDELYHRRHRQAASDATHQHRPDQSQRQSHPAAEAEADAWPQPDGAFNPYAADCVQATATAAPVIDFELSRVAQFAVHAECYIMAMRTRETENHIVAAANNAAAAANRPTH
jgi:hypothetical protein